jgi:nicotinamidase-related amidase
MSHTALLIIDMQTALLTDAYDADGCLSRVSALADRARTAGAPVVYLRQRPHGPVHPAVASQPADLVLDKDSADSFLGTPLAGVLDERGVRRVVVTGFATGHCVDSTSRAALAHGMDLVLASDAHTTVERGPDAALSAAQIIAHHNEIFSIIAYADRSIDVTPSARITFGPA